MSDSRTNSIIALAKKEFMDNVRSKWVLILGILFVALILLISAYGGYQSRQEAGIKGYKFTISFASSIVVLLISIVAIIMGYKTLVSEVETNSIALILSSELSRKDVVLGKFLGLSSVLAVSIIGGLGIGGIVIGITSGFENLGIYIQFIFLSVLFSMTYLSISVMASSFVKKTSRGLAAGIMVWVFFNIIYDILLVAVLLVSGWELPTEIGEIFYPDWYRYATLINPNGAFGMGASLITNSISNQPEFIGLPMLIVIMLIWIFVPLLIGMLYFDKKDL